VACAPPTVPFSRYRTFCKIKLHIDGAVNYFKKLSAFFSDTIANNNHKKANVCQLFPGQNPILKLDLKLASVVVHIIYIKKLLLYIMPNCPQKMHVKMNFCLILLFLLKNNYFT